MRDSQRSKVYAWENKLFQNHGLVKFIAPENFDDCMSLKECNRFATDVWNAHKNKFFRNYNEKRTRVAKVICSNNAGGRHAAAFMGNYFVSNYEKVKDGRNNCYKKMRLPRWGRSKHIIIHEVSHFLCHENEQHGRDFVGVYMILLNKYLAFSLQSMCDLAYSMNIDWSFSGSPNLNKAYKKAVQPEIDFEALRLGGVE